MFTLEESEGDAVRVNWLGESEVSAHQLLATPRDEEHVDARSEAVEFLMLLLADGPMLAKQGVEEADDAGIAEKTLRRAKKALDVIVYRENAVGETRDSGRWMWRLPVVELVSEADFQGSHEGVQDGQDALRQDADYLEQVKGTQMRKYSIGTPIVQDGHVDSSRWPNVQGGHRSSLPEGGYLKECGHGYQGGKGCYLCDLNHPYRKKGGAA
jgi:hypothetical protein